jgi:hypothetical protein
MEVDQTFQPILAETKANFATKAYISLQNKTRDLYTSCE